MLREIPKFNKIFEPPGTQLLLLVGRCLLLGKLFCDFPNWFIPRTEWPVRCPSLPVSNNRTWRSKELKLLFFLPHCCRLDEQGKKGPFHFLFFFLFLLSHHLLVFSLLYFLGIISNVSTILANHFILLHHPNFGPIALEHYPYIWKQLSRLLHQMMKDELLLHFGFFMSNLGTQLLPLQKPWKH